MVDAIIHKHLRLYRAKAILESQPIVGWTYRIFSYADRETYVPLTDRAAYTETTLFNTHTTCVLQAAFTPKKPQAHQQGYLELKLPRGCEAFVSIDGVRYAGVDNDAQRCRVYLTDDMYGRQIALELEVYACTFHEDAKSERPLRDPVYVIEDRELAAFAYDMGYVWDLTKYIRNEYTKRKVIALLEDTIRKSDVSLAYAAYLDNVRVIYQALLDGLQALRIDADEGVVDCVASTHIDVAWLWRFKDTIRKAGRSALNQLRLMDRFDEFTFSLSQPSVYNYIKEVYPDIFAQIRHRVQEGRWRLVGPMWVESDLNISGSESLVREFLYGHRFFLEEFGKTSDVCWIPDSFGFPASLPQIFAKCGMRSFYTTKVRWQTANEFPYNVFVWEGIDGSDLYATVPLTKDCYNNAIDNENVRLVSDKMQQKETWDHALMSYGYGDGGGGATEEMLQNYRLLQQAPGMPAVRLTEAEAYFDALSQKRDKLPVWKGELCVETHQGTYTTIADVKRNNRYAEMAFRRLDLLAVLASLRGRDAEYAQIVRHWKSLLLCQFHDVLPGSSIDGVYDDAEKIYADLFAFADQKEKQLVDDVLRTAAEDTVSVYNPNSFVGSAYVPVDPRYAGCAFTDGESVSDVLTDPDGRCVFFAGDVAPFGAKTFTKCAPVPAEQAVSAAEENGTVRIDTPHFRFVVRADGTLGDFYDKRADRTVGDGLNTFLTYQDGPEEEDAWNIDKEYKMRPVDMQWETGVRLLQADGERAIVRVEKKHGETVLSQDVIAYATIARVDFVSHIDWQEKYKILQVSFPVNVTATQASYEIAYGIVRRNTHANTPAEKWKHEYAAHRFTDLSDDVYGVSILNDCKYGHNVIDSTMVMTLFRNTDNPSRFRDTGRHDFAYAILPHVGGLSAGKVAQQGYLFNSPFLVFEGACKASPVVSLSNEGMIVDCIKPAEDGNGCIVRMYEPYGVPGRTTLRVPDGMRIDETSPLEARIAACSGEIAYRPFDIRTFRVFRP